MDPPPPEIDGARVVEFAVIDSGLRHTGGTRHFVGELLGPAAGLVLAKYADDEGVYLFYCDSDWKTLTDTYHEGVDAAKAQAAFEYEGVQTRWVRAV